MSPSRLILLSLIALTAAACASGPRTPEPIPGPEGSPQPLADHDWFVDDDGEGTRLTYGRDESDDVWLSLECVPGSGRIDMSHYLGPDEAAEVTLESGGDTETWPARALPDEITDGVYLSAQASAREPVFLRFRSTGWVASWGADGRVMMAAHPASAPRIERFFAACG